MSGVEEAFVYLQLEEAELQGSELLTREVGQSTDHGEILVAVDKNTHRHLLLPVGDEPVWEDASSQGVKLRVRDLALSGDQSKVYADLSCHMTELGLVFERLANDVLDRIDDEGTTPGRACRQALEDWRTLLRRASEGITHATMIGLIGELEMLRLLAERSLTSVLDVWRGPERSVHDFVNGHMAVEVKTTASIEGSVITISNIDQLDPSLVEDLHLVVVHLIADGTAPSLDERIDHLIELGVPREKLIERVGNAGYVYESAPEIDDRFAVRSLRCWTVTTDFPGLRSGDIPAERRIGVSDIIYRLNIDTAPPELDAEAFESFLTKWSAPPQ